MASRSGPRIYRAKRHACCFDNYCPNQNPIKKLKRRYPIEFPFLFVSDALISQQIQQYNQEIKVAHPGRYPARGCSGSAGWIKPRSIAAFITTEACAAFFLSIPNRSHKEAFFILPPPLRYWIIEWWKQALTRSSTVISANARGVYSGPL